MPQQQPSNNQPTNNSSSTDQGRRFPFFTRPGVLATRLVAASKSFFTTMSGGGPVVGLETGSGLFSGYRPYNSNFGNIPLSRFQTVNEYLGAFGSVASVYTCVSTISSSIAGLPIGFADQAGKIIATLGQKEAADDSLAALLENPNPYQDSFALMETIAAHQELCGNALMLMDNMDGQGRPECLYPLNPAYITLAVSPTNGLLGYIYQPPGSGARSYYGIDEILHFKSLNPSSIFWGQGTLQALASSLNTEIDIADSVQALYRNGAVIPGAFVAKEVLSDTEFKKLKDQLMQDHTGSSNFFKPLLLDGGLDWKSMSIGHTDLGTTDLRKLNREDIYMAFGVPVSEAGNQGRANVKNDHLTDVYWLNTIGPKAHRIEVGFRKLTRRYDPRYSIKLPLPVKVAEGEMLDNVAKVDGLTSISVSEKRVAIKSITGDQFGWGKIPDEMPIEPGDPNAPQPLGPDAGQLPPGPEDGGDGGGMGDTGADPNDLPLADAVKSSGMSADDIQNLVDRGILEPEYLDLADDAKGLRNLAKKLGYTTPGQGVRTVKRPGSRGGHPWTDKNGKVHYGPQPTGRRSARGGATKPKAPTAKKRANATGPKPKKQPLKNPDGTTFRKLTPARKLAQQKKKLRELDKVFKDGKDPHGNPLDAATLDHVNFLATSLRTDLNGKAMSDTTSTAPQHTGIMVAFYLPPEVSQQLALKGGEAPEELHLTLGYLGDSTEMDPDTEIDLYETVKDFADRQEPLTGQISGIGLFLNTDEGADTNAFYASFDSPDLPDFRADLIEQLQEAGIPILLNHGFTPHITLQYVAAGKPLPATSVPVTDVTFDRVTVKWGDNRVDFPLLGTNEADEEDEVDEAAEDETEDGE
jgi:HK97 family phage portal protein